MLLNADDQICLDVAAYARCTDATSFHAVIILLSGNCSDIRVRNTCLLLDVS